jgi:hypothetical protein
MTFAALVAHIVDIANYEIVPFIIALAFLFFIWGVFQYFFLGATDSEKQAQGRSFVLWSVLALAVIFSVWGLVNIVLATLMIG